MPIKVCLQANGRQNFSSIERSVTFASQEVRGLIRPETRYARSADVHIAYQVVGNGPIDIVFVQGFISNLEVQWEDPGLTHLFNRLGAFARLIVFDKRGSGLSDRVSDMPNLETRMDDVRAVMDAGGSPQAA